MTEIVSSIDAWMETNYGSYSHTFWGFCELAKRTHENKEQPIPVTINGTHKRSQVSLDDKKQMVTWFRLVNTVEFGNEIEGNDWSFGLEDSNVQTATLRMVIATKVEIGENLIFSIAKKMPGIFSAAGYTIISIDRSGLTIDTNHEEIYLTELGQGKYEQHRFPWNLNVLNIPVSFILCEATQECCNQSILEEDEDCLILE